MLFKELYALWKADDSLTQAINDSHFMLGKTYEMFRESIKSLREKDDGELELNVYESDQIVNKYMQEVRKKVLRYLAVTGGMNIIPGLVLTSIVIDIERIGDYTKNITDLAVNHPRRLDGLEYEEDFKKIEKTVDDIFQRLIPILKSSDKAAAARLSQETHWVLKRCDEILDSIIVKENENQSPRDAASRALYARYLKRIAAHLLNIASSVVNPFEQIGFKAEGEEKN